MENEVFTTAYELMGQLQRTQGANILAAAKCIADTFEAGGILQAFGSGHSNAGALELCHRAGGFVPTKAIREPANGLYESVPGVAEIFLKKVDIRENDVVFIISNSGRNPLPLEIACEARRRGAKVVAVTSVEASKKLTSKHKSGKRLFELADVVIDNQVPDGDACVHLDGLDTGICGMSTITTAVALQAVVLEAAKMLLSRGVTPPFFKSQNIDGGEAYNQLLLDKHFDRLYHM
ncbi:MAG: SIS domain-containing protein [Oscillospiraceae bacterium]|nr:SIS domain-containing protein [Oscillospiraceae bacterium]